MKLSIQRLMGLQLVSLGMTWILTTGIWMTRATVEGWQQLVKSAVSLLCCLSALHQTGNPGPSCVLCMLCNDVQLQYSSVKFCQLLSFTCQHARNTAALPAAMPPAAAAVAAHAMWPSQNGMSMQLHSGSSYRRKRHSAYLALRFKFWRAVSAARGAAARCQLAHAGSLTHSAFVSMPVRLGPKTCQYWAILDKIKVFAIACIV